MQKHGLIGIVVLLFACTFLTVIYELADNGHFVEKNIPPNAHVRQHEVKRPGKAVVVPEAAPSAESTATPNSTGSPTAAQP